MSEASSSYNKNPEFYYLDFGTYNDSTSNSIAQSFINLRDLNIRSRVRKGKKGGQGVDERAILCYIECESGETFSVKSCVKGKL